jgi:hypothetical protein
LLREAGIPFSDEGREEIRIGRSVIRASKVTIPALRIGAHIFRELEAYVIPRENRHVPCSLSRVPGYSLRAEHGSNVLMVRPTR